MGTADNQIQQWYIEDAGNGSFYIRNAYSNKYLTSNSTSRTTFQTRTRRANQQRWQFVLSNPNSPAKAQYGFQANVDDSAEPIMASRSGNPTYGTGPSGQGQAINLNGANDYVTLPSGVANSSNITISAYVKWDGGNAWQRIFDFGNNTQPYMFLTPKSGDNTMRLCDHGRHEASRSWKPLRCRPANGSIWPSRLAATRASCTSMANRASPGKSCWIRPTSINVELHRQEPVQRSAVHGHDRRLPHLRLRARPRPGRQLRLPPLDRRARLEWTTAVQTNPKNWQHQLTAEDYVNGNGVLFDDYATKFTVNLADGNVSPASVQFENARNDYVLNGPGAITGSASLVKNSYGALTINNGNIYTGGTVLNGGTLNLNNASAIGTGVLTIKADATINNTSGCTHYSFDQQRTYLGRRLHVRRQQRAEHGDGAATMTGNRTVTVNGTGALTVGPIGESGGARQLTKAGPGTLVLTGTTSYTGSTYVTGGTLSVAGTLNSAGTDVWVGQGDGSSGSLVVPSGGTVTANVLLVGAGGSPAAVATGTGTLASGGTINTNRWFVLGHSGAAGSSGSFTVNGGTLNIHTNAAVSGNLEIGTFDATSAILDVNTGSNVELLNNALLVFGAQANHTGTGVVNHNGGNVTFYSDGGATVGGTGRLRHGQRRQPDRELHLQPQRRHAHRAADQTARTPPTTRSRRLQLQRRHAQVLRQPSRLHEGSRRAT